jgi:RsiW-degrading membrane proteinase PrsW (M82 family)
VAGAVVALLPVLAFLAALVFMDSFKLVPLRQVAVAIGAGAAAALFCAGVNALLLGPLGLEKTIVTRFAAPLVEELAKLVYVGLLIRRQRVGFLVDAAICGFAIGTGFALFENLDYLRSLPGSGLGLWVIRGFGTALLHGSTTGLAALVSMSLAEKLRGPVTFAPGLALAVLLHAAFNHFASRPLLGTLLLLTLMPVLFVLVFERSERATRAWLGVGFDSDAELLRSIASGQVSGTRVGEYLESLKARFPGTILADMLCLLRLHLELSIRAKGMLLAREAGFPLPPGDDVEASFKELRYLEKEIGPTGLLALKPIQTRSSRDLWELYVLEQARSD